MMIGKLKDGVRGRGWKSQTLRPHAVRKDFSAGQQSNAWPASGQPPSNFKSLFVSYLRCDEVVHLSDVVARLVTGRWGR